MSIHQESFKIRGNETGPNFKVTMPAIAGFLQEAAWMHSMRLKVSIYDILEKGYIWVLARLSIEMKEFVRHNEVLTVTTWPSGFDRHNIFRDYLLQNKNGVTLGTAKSVWVILDLKSRQIIAAPPFITDLTLQNEVPNIPNKMEKIPVFDTYDYVTDFIANWHDIDVNQHVNHISYIKWVIESAPPEILKTKEATCIDIVFRSEGKYANEITGYAKSIDESSIMHRLRLKNTTIDLALANTKWG